MSASFMELALAEAASAAARGEVPVGAVLVEAASGAVLAICSAVSSRSGDRDPAGHYRQGDSAV